MKSFNCFALIFVLATSIEVMSAAEEAGPVVHEFKPRPMVYSMHIREFHECVSCNDDEEAGKDFTSCLFDLPGKYQKMYNTCCKETFSGEFCKESAAGKTDFKTICSDPRKGLEVERCFWKKIDGEKIPAIEDFRECKKRILQRYCTSKSSNY